MTAVPRTTDGDQNRVFEDPDAFFALLDQSFRRAARAAVAENDRLGIPTHGAVNGKPTVRQPRKVKTLDKA